MAVTPLYKVVEKHIRQKVRSGELVPGDLIPSEPQLAQTLGVSTGTVKKAIENLATERLLYRHQGKGTYVSRIDFNNSLFRFFSYAGHDGVAVRIHKETTIRKLMNGSKDICRKLEVEPDTQLLYIERVGYVKQDPILVEKCWWLAELVSGLEQEEVHIPDLMYTLVVERFGVPVIRSEETLTAGAADKSIANLLNIKLRDPVVVLHRLTYTVNDKPIEYRITQGRADRFSYKTEIR